MENRFQKLIEKNENIEFVTHVQTREELEELITALETLEFEYAIPLGSLWEMAEQFVADDGYDGCWRISRERGIAYHPSVEHWKCFTNDIVELQNGEVVFHDGYHTEEAVQIESKKLWRDFTNPDDSPYARKLFGLQDATPEELQCWIKEHIVVSPREKIEET